MLPVTDKHKNDDIRRHRHALGDVNQVNWCQSRWPADGNQAWHTCQVDVIASQVEFIT